MLKIIEGEADVDLASEREETEDDVLDQIVASVRDGETEEVPQTEDEMFAAAGLTRPEPVVKQQEDNSLAEIFGLDEPDPRDPVELEMEEEIRVYEPGNRKKDGIPILTEDKDPELAPITVSNRKNTRKPVREAPQKTEKQEEVEQKKRPFLVVLLLLAVLLIAAVVAKILISAFSDVPGREPSNVVVVVPEGAQDDGSPDANTDVAAIMSEEQEQQQAEQEQQQAEAEQPAIDPETLPHTYEAVRADVGWNQARQEAINRGGYLVTVNSEDELNQVIALAEEAGFDRIWIGAHRVDGDLVWESGEDVTFYRWDEGEPSFTDKGDDTAEDYLMLWQRGGIWC